MAYMHLIRSEAVRVPETDRRTLLSERNRPNHSEHNYFSFGKKRIQTTSCYDYKV